ncbi:5-oxoprolinase [Pueribacillus theae]|uniref:5-oxoprolinase n=1 Tax=Pueribacillus theae TaxID=2171751 RepID=A0A2U1JWL7_9BACI|nr:hydantoinase/oxoprolinase family protein [Pueribacillus theae]PWA09223.1 5-oxoprolinase [Pueribacillus theae]
MGYEVGIDIGGTFTDVVVTGTNQLWTAKALSTKDIVSGILVGLEEVSKRMDIGVRQLVPKINRFVLGNTIVTNAIDEMRLAKVGLLTTKGFADTLRIARSARGSEYDPHLQKPKPDIVDRQNIVEITERVDVNGDEVVKLDEEQIRNELKNLLDKGVQAIAVCFLFSFRNPKHEQRVKEILAELAPEVPCTLSSEIAPMYREYERMVTTVLDAAVKPIVERHFEELERKFNKYGLQCEIKIMQVNGGFASIGDVIKKPIYMFNSGPVGGVVASKAIGNKLNIDKIITADMGGTTFDTSFISDGEARIVQRAEIGEFSTSLTVVDIEGIGAGGGSIAWLDSRGLLRVGPKSAGANPGPVCYDNGGTEPTVTDAAVVLNLLDPNYYLGGSVEINRDKAVQAIKDKLADSLDLSIEKTASGIYQLTIHQMANAIRSITINRGYDPRDFSLVSFGGATGLFVAAIGHELGINEIIIPKQASVFSATGLLQAEAIYTTSKTAPWTFNQSIDYLNTVFNELDQKALEWFEKESIPEETRILIREVDMKFNGQIFEVATRIPNGVLTEEDKTVIRQSFIEDYEKEFGAGTAWEDAEILLVNARIRAVGGSKEAAGKQMKELRTGVELLRKDMRDVFEPMSGELLNIPVYRDGIESAVSGTCILELPDTTIFVPKGGTLEPLDSLDGYRLVLK